MQIASISGVFLDRLTTLKHIANAREDHTITEASLAEEKLTSHGWFGGNTLNRYDEDQSSRSGIG